MSRPRLLTLLTVVVFLFPAGRASAENYIPAQMSASELLQKADEAKGHLQAGRYAILEQSRSGAVTTTLVTRIDGDDFMTAVSSGDFRTAYGNYKGRAWQQDENGIVRYMHRASPTSRALMEPAQVQSGVHVLGLTQSAPQEYVVDVHPRAGDEELRYYDAKTVLLDRIVTKYVNGVTSTERYGDYRKVFGEMRAFRWEYSDGRPQNDETLQTISFDRSDYSAPLEPPKSYALYQVPKGKTVTLPAKFDNGEVVVTIDAGGHAFDFVLDTGASDLSIDAGALHSLGITPYGRSKARVGGDFDVSRAVVPNVSVGPFEMHNVVFDVIPFSVAGRVGLLGCDFLASGIVGVDIKHKKVTVTSPESFDPKALGLVAVPADLDDCVPEVHASFDGISGKFLMDLGGEGTLLQRPFAEKIPSRRMPNPYNVSTINFIGGSVNVRFYEIPDMIFGPIRFRTATVVVPDERSADDPANDGIIGRDVLAAYLIYLDYETGTVYLKPNR
jgi:Aspartyl protease